MRKQVTTVLLTSLGVLGLGLPVASSAHMMGEYNTGYHMMDGYWGWGGAILALLFFILIGVAIALIIKRFAYSSRGQKYQGQGDNSKPLEILKQRYAKGEINKEEFEERKKVILQ